MQQTENIIRERVNFLDRFKESITMDLINNNVDITKLHVVTTYENRNDVLIFCVCIEDKK